MIKCGVFFFSTVIRLSKSLWYWAKLRTQLGHTPPLPSEPVGSAQLLFDSLCVPFELELIIFTFIFCKCSTGVKGIIDRQNDDLKILQGRGRGKMR